MVQRNFRQSSTSNVLVNWGRSSTGKYDRDRAVSSCARTILRRNFTKGRHGLMVGKLVRSYIWQFSSVQIFFIPSMLLVADFVLRWNDIGRIPLEPSDIHPEQSIMEYILEGRVPIRSYWHIKTPLGQDVKWWSNQLLLFSIPSITHLLVGRVQDGLLSHSHRRKPSSLL